MVVAAGLDALRLLAALLPAPLPAPHADRTTEAGVISDSSAAASGGAPASLPGSDLTSMLLLRLVRTLSAGTPSQPTLRCRGTAALAAALLSAVASKTGAMSASTLLLLSGVMISCGAAPPDVRVLLPTTQPGKAALSLLNPAEGLLGK